MRLYRNGIEGVEAEADDEGCVIVDRDPGAPVAGGVGTVGANHRVEGHEELGDSPVVRAFRGLPPGADAATVVGVDDLEARVLIGAADLLDRQLLARYNLRHVDLGVDEGGVALVDVTLHGLDPVAVLDALAAHVVLFYQVSPL